MRARTALMGGALLAGLLTAPTSPAQARADDGHRATYELRTVPPTDRADVVERRVATFTEADRPSGVAVPSTPHYRLLSGGITVDLDDAKVYGNVRIAGEPPSDQRPTVFYHVGNVVGRDCQIGDTAVLDRMIGVESYENGPLPTAWRTGRCAAVVLREPVDGAIVDVLVDGLQDQLPSLSLSGASVLGSKRLGLVKGVWTQVAVPVRNAGPGIATTVTVTGSGKGLAVRRGTLGHSLGAGQSGTVSVMVRLQGKQKRTRLALTATVGSVTARRTEPVRRVAPPRRPAAGQYRTTRGSGSFVVRRGKVVGFRISTTTRCGIRVTQNTYSFRTVAVPRNGIVQAQERGSLYTTSLAMKVVGGRATHGRFSYSGPGGCFAVEAFSARRG